MLVERIASRWSRPLLVAGTLGIGFVAAAGGGQSYYQHGAAHTSSPAGIVAELEGENGYVYSMFPSFALVSDRELYPWHAGTRTVDRGDRSVPKD